MRKAFALHWFCQDTYCSICFSGVCESPVLTLNPLTDQREVLSDERVVIFLLIWKLGNVSAAQSSGFKAKGRDSFHPPMCVAPLEGLRGLTSYEMTRCSRLRVCTAMVKTPYSGQRLWDDGGLEGRKGTHGPYSGSGRTKADKLIIIRLMLKVAACNLLLLKTWKMSSWNPGRTEGGLMVVPRWRKKRLWDSAALPLRAEVCRKRAERKTLAWALCALCQSEAKKEEKKTHGRKWVLCETKMQISVCSGGSIL